MESGPEAGEILASVPFTDRQRIANVIRDVRRHRRQDWARRHGSQPLRAELLLRESGSLDGYADGYLWPLLWTLEHGIRWAREDYLRVYQFERLRFSGTLPLDDPTIRELRNILEGDLEDIVTRAGSGTTLRGLLTTLLTAVHGPITARVPGHAVTIAMVGDCVMNETLTFLHPVLRSAGVDLTARHTYFSAGQQIALDTDTMKAELAAHGADLVFLSFLTFEGLPPYRSLLRDAAGLSVEQARPQIDALLAAMFGFVSDVREQTGAPIVLHGCSGLPLRRVRLFAPLLPPLARATRRVTEALDAGLRDIAGAVENTLFLDEAHLVRSVGFRAASRRVLPRWVTHRGPFHPSRLGMLLASEYASVAQAYLMLAKAKVLLVDFDNTLWSGVVGEGRVEHDLRAQRVLRQLQRAGILLVAVSKNDPTSIPWDEMLLEPDDFVLHKINWNPKPRSVAEVAAELNLDPSSFVLIDDSPVERALITQAWPSVGVLDPTDSETWRRLEMMLAFPNTRATREAARRTETYREAAARREAIAAPIDYASMMAGLRLTAGWRLAGLRDVDRVQELMSRTNQFNTTTLRLTTSQLTGLVRSPDADVWVATLADRFGDLGLVGAVVTTRTPERVVFDAVVMSCRAMGFGLENLLVRGPIDAAPGRVEAIGRFVPTERNGPCAGLFRDLGFALRPDGSWSLDLGGELPAVPDWLTVRS